MGDSLPSRFELFYPIHLSLIFQLALLKAMRTNARDILSLYVTSLAHIIAPVKVVLLIHLIQLSLESPKAYRTPLRPFLPFTKETSDLGFFCH